jgi:hypothetical protein
LQDAELNVGVALNATVQKLKGLADAESLKSTSVSVTGEGIPAPEIWISYLEFAAVKRSCPVVEDAVPGLDIATPLSSKIDASVDVPCRKTVTVQPGYDPTSLLLEFIPCTTALVPPTEQLAVNA